MDKEARRGGGEGGGASWREVRDEMANGIDVYEMKSPFASLRRRLR